MLKITIERKPAERNRMDEERFKWICGIFYALIAAGVILGFFSLLNH